MNIDLYSTPYNMVRTSLIYMPYNKEYLTEVLDEKEVRKLQLVGGSTYVLSLPKKWVDDMSLKTGDPVSIFRTANNSLSLLPSKNSKTILTAKSQTAISQKDSIESVKRKIIAMYLAGYQIIEIKSKGGRIQLDQKQAIRDLVRTNMIGTEIVESTSESITIQILTSLPELSIADALKRIFLLTSTMPRQTNHSLKKINL